MNRRQKRANEKANIKEINKKSKDVAAVQARAFIKLGTYIETNYPGVGLSKEQVEALMDGGYEEPLQEGTPLYDGFVHDQYELQKLFTAYKEAKHAGVVLAMMKKQIKENGIPDAPKTKQEVMGVNIEANV